MPTRKSGGKSAARATSKNKRQVGSDMAVGTTVSGPSHPTASPTELADHAAEQQALAEAMPFNSVKGSEYGAPSTSAPPEGPHQPMPSPTTGAGTLSEKNESLKTGPATLDPQSLDGSLEGKRVYSEGQVLTTNQGVPAANNQDSLKAAFGARRYSRTSSSARRSLTLTMSASPSASCTPEVRVRTASLRRTNL